MSETAEIEVKYEYFDFPTRVGIKKIAIDIRFGEKKTEILEELKIIYAKSDIAKDYFDEWFANNLMKNPDGSQKDVIEIYFLEGDAKGNIGFGRIGIDLEYANSVLYLDNKGNVQKHTTRSILVHELMHTLPSKRDNAQLLVANQLADYQQEAVAAANEIYDQLGIVRQNSYIGQDDSKYKSENNKYKILDPAINYTGGYEIDRSMIMLYPSTGGIGTRRIQLWKVQETY